MRVNGKEKEMGLRVPTMIGIRTKELEPLLSKWRERNRRVPWTCLLRDALRHELSPLAGKRYAHLLGEGKRAA